MLDWFISAENYADGGWRGVCARARVGGRSSGAGPGAAKVSARFGWLVAHARSRPGAHIPRRACGCTRMRYATHRATQHAWLCTAACEPIRAGMYVYACAGAGRVAERLLRPGGEERWVDAPSQHSHLPLCPPCAPHPRCTPTIHPTTNTRIRTRALGCPGPSPHHGTGGTMSTEQPRYQNVLHEEFFRSAEQAGLKANPDFNDWSRPQDGYGEFQVRGGGGLRVAVCVYVCVCAGVAGVAWSALPRARGRSRAWGSPVLLGGPRLCRQLRTPAPASQSYQACATRARGCEWRRCGCLRMG